MDGLIAVLTVIALVYNFIAKVNKASKESSVPNRQRMPQPNAAEQSAGKPKPPVVLPSEGMTPQPVSDGAQPLAQAEAQKAPKRKKKKKQLPLPQPVEEPVRVIPPPPPAPTREAGSPLVFSQNPVVQAVVFSEILGKPKSMR